MGLHGPAAWSTTLATVLRSKVPLTGDGFRMAPPAEDPFWQTAQKELETGLGSKADAFWAAVSAALASRLGLECFPRSPAALAEYVSELESIDVTEVAPGLFLGNLSARSSELALCLLRCDRVVAVVPEGHSGKDLRESSGPARRYMPVDGAAPLAQQLPPVVEFIRGGRTLVCSETGRGVAAALCAGAIAAAESITASAAARRVEARRGPVDLTIDSLEELATFADDLRSGIPPPPPPPPATPPSSAAPPPWALPAASLQAGGAAFPSPPATPDAKHARTVWEGAEGSVVEEAPAFPTPLPPGALATKMMPAGLPMLPPSAGQHGSKRGRDKKAAAPAAAASSSTAAASAVPLIR
uniref:Uncharacterized protein n=1 Tax=Emiliania huxleyi TaxID=2903 RepID=A0A7S3RTC7_EMIHU|mmetsp:Transcript_7120/g.20333  ORF Transcript_7120/g.20333 Transcript_7120/m.20333 type:complete len:356 (+) Transcript_7120:138-1205(+)